VSTENSMLMAIEFRWLLTTWFRPIILTTCRLFIENRAYTRPSCWKQDSHSITAFCPVPAQSGYDGNGLNVKSNPAFWAGCYSRFVPKGSETVQQEMTGEKHRRQKQDS